MDRFVSGIAEQFETTAREKFTPGTKFQDIEEWDSVTAISVIAMIEEEYGVILSNADLNRTRTINDLYEVVKAKAEKEQRKLALAR